MRMPFSPSPLRVWLLCGCLGLLATGFTLSQPAESGNDVKGLLDQFQKERNDAATSGAAKLFSAERLTRAESFAQQAQKALDAGQANAARDFITRARWMLPMPPAEVPTHLTRVLGSLKLRHSGDVYCVAYS